MTALSRNNTGDGGFLVMEKLPNGSFRERYVRSLAELIPTVYVKNIQTGKRHLLVAYGEGDAIQIGLGKAED